MTIPEVRLIEHDGVHYAAAVLLVPRGEEVRPKDREPLSFYYTIAGPDWTHWGYTSSWSRAWGNVRRVTKRHRARMEKRNG